MLSVRDLKVRFASRHGIIHAGNGVSFDVPANTRVGVVGESGSGKSVMLGAVLGLLRGPGVEITGSALLEGEDLMAARPSRLRSIRGARIGYVAQNPFGALNPILTIRAQFRNLVRAHETAGRDDIDARALAMLERVGIREPRRVLDGYAHELSGGMAQRVVIAMALILGPRLVVADEPTTALDLTVQKQILHLIDALVTAENRSLLIVTHDLGVVAQFCDEVIVMYCGQVVERGPVGEVFGDPAHPYTRALLGAIPRPGHELRALQGRLPDLRRLPKGCLFRDRCPLAFDRCADERPASVALNVRRQAACHLNQEAADAAG